MERVNVPIILERLRELADRSSQQRLWLAASGPEVSSFVEVVCGLYDDSNLGNELDRSHTVFSEAIDANLRILDKKLQAIDSDRYPSEIIEDSKMEEVRVLATELLDMLAREGVS